MMQPRVDGGRKTLRDKSFCTAKIFRETIYNQKLNRNGVQAQKTKPMAPDNLFLTFFAVEWSSAAPQHRFLTKLMGKK